MRVSRLPLIDGRCVRRRNSSAISKACGGKCETAGQAQFGPEPKTTPMEVAARHLWTERQRIEVSEKATIDDVFVEVSVQLETAELSEGCIQRSGPEISTNRR